jgi:hypothetical protein
MQEDNRAVVATRTVLALSEQLEARLHKGTHTARKGLSLRMATQLMTLECPETSPTLLPLSNIKADPKLYAV